MHFFWVALFIPAGLGTHSVLDLEVLVCNYLFLFFSYPNRIFFSVWSKMNNNNNKKGGMKLVNTDQWISENHKCELGLLKIAFIFTSFSAISFIHGLHTDQCCFQSEEPHDTMPISSFLQKERPRTAAFTPAYTPPR